MNLPSWLRKALGMSDPTLIDPKIAELQVALARAKGEAEASARHAADTTKQLQQSQPAPIIVQTDPASRVYRSTDELKAAFAGINIYVDGYMLQSGQGGINFYKQADESFTITPRPKDSVSPAVEVPQLPVPPPPAAVGDGGSISQPVTLPSEYPKRVTIEGVNFNLKEPVSPLWKPSQTAWVFGHFQDVYVDDPSNGDKVVPPQPLRSPAGFPMRYALGAGNAIVGTPGVVYADDTFNTDDEVMRVINHAPPPAATGSVDGMGAIPVETLTLHDAAYIQQCVLSGKYADPGMLFYRVLSGSHADIATRVEWGLDHVAKFDESKVQQAIKDAVVPYLKG